MSDCANIDKCGFFKKYQSTKELACMGFLHQFCQGPKQSECKRKEYRQEHGCAPSDDMMPNGSVIAG